MKAKRKPLDIKTPEDLKLSVETRLTVLSTKAPAERTAGIKVGSVSELLEKLKENVGEI